MDSIRDRAALGRAFWTDMYRNAVLFAAGGLALAALAPSLFTRGNDATPDPGALSAGPVADAKPPDAQAAGPSFREAVLPADPRGQYGADAVVNGVPVRMLVDTGASIVVLSAATAGRLGLAADSRAKLRVQTANGVTSATPVVLHNVSLGGLYMNDVQAVILPPEAGEVNLLGASFLKRLMSVEQRNGTLVLRQ